MRRYPRRRKSSLSRSYISDAQCGNDEFNLRWHPKAEDWLWRPELQQKRLSQNGMLNLRYKVHDKRRYLESFLSVIRRTLPACQVRYAF